MTWLMEATLWELWKGKLIGSRRQRTLIALSRRGLIAFDDAKYRYVLTPSGVTTAKKIADSWKRLE